MVSLTADLVLSFLLAMEAWVGKIADWTMRTLMLLEISYCFFGTQGIKSPKAGERKIMCISKYRDTLYEQLGRKFGFLWKPPKMSPSGNRAKFPNAREKWSTGWSSLTELSHWVRPWWLQGEDCEMGPGFFTRHGCPAGGWGMGAWGVTWDIFVQGAKARMTSMESHCKQK